MKILIIGGGITGLITGLSFLPYTDDITIIDNQPIENIPQDGWISLMPDTLAHLHSLGIISDIHEQASAVKTRDIRVAGVIYPDNVQACGQYSEALWIPEKDLWSLLYQKLGKNIIQSSRKTIQNNETSVTVSLQPLNQSTENDSDDIAEETSESTTQNVDLVCACDGVNSLVRKTFFADQESQTDSLWHHQAILTVEPADPKSTESKKDRQIPGGSIIVAGDNTLDDFFMIDDQTVLRNSYSNTDPGEPKPPLNRATITSTQQTIHRKTSNHRVKNPIKQGIILCGSAIVDFPMIGGTFANARQLIPRIPRRFAQKQGYHYPGRKTLGEELGSTALLIKQNTQTMIKTIITPSRKDRGHKFFFLWTGKTPDRVFHFFVMTQRTHPSIGSLDSVFPRFLESFIGGPSRYDAWRFFDGPNPGVLAPFGYLVLQSNQPKISRDTLLSERQSIIFLFGGIGEKIQERHHTIINALSTTILHAKIFLITDSYDIHQYDQNPYILGDHQGDMHQKFAAHSECIYVINPDGSIGRRSLGYRINDLQEWRETYRSH